MSQTSGTIHNIHYGDILTFFPTVLDCSSFSVPYIRNSSAIPNKSDFLQEGDVVFADTAEDYTTGKAIEIKGSSAILSGLHTIPCRPFMKFATGYLGYYLNSVSFRKQLIPLIQGIKVYSISKTALMGAKVHFPNYLEQQKIASLLMQIDERIAVQNKIISSLHSLKQAISATLFRDVDSEVMLEEICHVTKGQQLNASNFDDSGEYFVINGGSEPSGRFTRFNRLGETITISEGGNSCGYVDWQREPFWCGGHCYSIEKIDESILPRYLFHYLKFKQSELMSLRVGTGLPNIQKQSLSEFLVKTPEIHDQKRIAKILDSIERKIQIEIELATLYRHQKEYLLNNLFI